MSADHLREAAKVLRESAEAATQGAELDRYPHGGGRLAIFAKDETRTLVADFYQEGDREFYAMMHPGVGLALADLLDAQAEHIAMYYCATQCEPDGCDETKAALTVADLILGGTS